MENNANYRSTGIEIPKNQGDSYVKLNDILNQIPNGSSYYWSIQLFDIQGYTGKSNILEKIKEDISKKGYCLTSWNELKLLAEEITQFIWFVLVGSSDRNALKVYPTDLDRYESTDYNIEAFDGWLWDIFSTNYELIYSLEKKFIKSKPIKPDETEDWQRY